MTINNVKTLVKNGPRYFGMQFDGTNATEIVSKLREVLKNSPEFIGSIRNSKQWIKLTYGDTSMTVTKGAWFLWTDEGIKVVEDEVFQDQFKRDNPRAKKAEPRYVKSFAEGYFGLQFTGKNSTDVAQFIREHGFSARAGGSYVRFTPGDEKITIQKGEWIIFPQGKSRAGWAIGDQDQVEKRFRIS